MCSCLRCVHIDVCQKVEKPSFSSSLLWLARIQMKDCVTVIASSVPYRNGRPLKRWFRIMLTGGAWLL